MNETVKFKTTRDNWTLIITPQRKWFDLHLGELWRYRDLVMLFVRRDFVASYKQTILGPLWYPIQPIISTIIFTIVFGNIARLPTDGSPAFLFYMAGNTMWNYFSSCLMDTSKTFIGNVSIFGKVYFPRLSVPVSLMISNLIAFAIRFGVFLAFWIYFLLMGVGIHPNAWILLLPVQLLIMAGLGLGLGITLSSMTVKYRDLQQLLGFGVQLLMYATPIIYPLSTVKGIWRWMILANPMTAVVETFRLGFLGVGTINPLWLCYSTLLMLIMLFLGLLLFNHVEASFMDTV